MPSFELARQEMARDGVELEFKTVRRISERLGSEFLTVRTRDLMEWREGKIPAGDDLTGKRIAVAIDGGRTRLREQRRGQRRKGKRITRRRRYKGQWREPKLVTIFELDKKGRMKRGTQAWIDGTFEGPDHLMELVAFHLHRLGAGKAKTVAFLSDGAPWIWDRLDWVQRTAGIRQHKTERILDWCHAVHHVSLSLDQLNMSKTARRRTFRRLRQHLCNGRADLVVRELSKRAAGKAKTHDVWTQIEYLKKHLAHMDYKRLRRCALPMGSGAIESAIRRVVNQRLKGNGIMWLKENAEAMLVLRAAALTDRWEESLEHASSSMACNRRLDWKWQAPAIVTQRADKPQQPKPRRNLRSPPPQVPANQRQMATVT